MRCEFAIKVSASNDWIMHKFFEVFTEFAEECSLLGDIARCIDVNKNERLFFMRYFQKNKSAVFVRDEFFYLEISRGVN